MVRAERDEAWVRKEIAVEEVVVVVVVLARRTLVLAAVLSAETISSFPSPLTSPRATEVGVVPVE